MTVRTVVLKMANGEMFTLPQLAKKTKRSHTAALRAVERLIEGGYVVRNDEPLYNDKRGRPATVYMRRVQW